MNDIKEPNYSFHIDKKAHFELSEISKYFRLPKIRTLIFIIHKYYCYLIKKGKIAGTEEKIK